jgi:multiple antibiotic resistance protein
MNTLLQDAVALLAITNPLGAIPAFLAITERMDSGGRLRAGIRASLAVGIILFVAALAGKPILRAFGISMPAFQAAGGLVILLMGLEMLRGVPTKVQHDEASAESADERVLVPLAMPLVAGPGAITTVITLSARASGWQETLADQTDRRARSANLSPLYGPHPRGCRRPGPALRRAHLRPLAASHASA